MKVQPNSSILIFLALLVSFGFSQSSKIKMVICGNINGAFADCLCQEGNTGSFARFYTFYSQVKNNKCIWINSGNFLTSYQSPKYNRFLLNQFSTVEFDIVAAGEFEFYHHRDILSLIFYQHQIKNLLLTNSCTGKEMIDKFKFVSRQGYSFLFLNLIPPSIKNPDLSRYIQFTDTDSMIQNIMERHAVHHVFVFIILQGSMDEARLILKKYKRISGVILGNNNREYLELDSESKRFILSPGVEAEYAVSVELSIKDDDISGINGQIIDLKNIEEDSRLLMEYQNFKNKYEINQ